MFVVVVVVTVAVAEGDGYQHGCAWSPLVAVTAFVACSGSAQVVHDVVWLQQS